MSNSTGGDARVTEEIKHGILVRQQLFFTLTKQTITLFIPCLIVAACRLFQSMSSNTLTPASLNPRPSVNFKTLIVLFFDSDSDSSSFSMELCLIFNKMVEHELLVFAV
jgi:hypothetical protein